jgi:hypothetical protein
MAEPMTWWLQIGDKTSTGSASGSGRESAPDPTIFRECYGCQGNVTKGQTQEINDRLGAVHIDEIDGDAKPDQHGCGLHNVGCGSARASCRKAFLSRTIRG